MGKRKHRRPKRFDPRKYKKWYHVTVKDSDVPDGPKLGSYHCESYNLTLCCENKRTAAERDFVAKEIAEYLAIRELQAEGVERFGGETYGEDDTVYQDC